MKVLKTLDINNKKAEIVLLEDNTVSILYDGVTILKDLSWSTIKDDTDILEILLRAEVEVRLDGQA